MRCASDKILCRIDSLRISYRPYELRKSRNFTQSAVSLRLNLSLSRLSAYENGENIPCDVLREFADFYGVSIDYILCFSDDKSSGFTASLRLSEQKLLDMYRNLAPDAKALIDGMVNGYAPQTTATTA